jgi:hypothetical protein
MEPDTVLRHRLLTLTVSLIMALALVPSASAQLPSLPGASVPVITSPNVEVVNAFPMASVVAVTFDPLEPIMYATTLAGFGTFDISNPEVPVPLGFLPFPHFSNENMKLGVRDDGTKLVMAGFDLVGYSPQAGLTNTRGTSRFVVIDVTDPAMPSVASSVNTTSRTHTMGCANTECTHAYTAGSAGGFDIIDLEDIENPVNLGKAEFDVLAGNQTFGGGVGHDWDLDADGVAWLVGSGGITAFDTSDPANPRIMNSSDHRSRATEFNKYISHNSQRPDAGIFESRDPDDVIAPTPPAEDADFRDGGLEDNRGLKDFGPGEILFVTEEDLSSTAGCGGTRGSFQAWHVQELDADRYETTINPDAQPDSGTISPVGKWTTEMAENPALHTETATFCSAHYFDVHQSGIVAHAWYQQGLRFLDASDPTDIRQIGFFVTGAQEIFGAKWVPEYDENGQTGLKTNIVYTEDPSRGIEVLRVDIPEDNDDAPTVQAPILPEWGEAGLALRARAADTDSYGYMCLLR